MTVGGEYGLHSLQLGDTITRAAMQSLDLEVTARHLNEVEAVQHDVHFTNIPLWFGLLGDV